MGRFQLGFRLAVCLTIAAFFSGCALTTDKIELEYVPGSCSTLEGAEAIKVKAEVVDLRSVKDKVSHKKNGYGMEMAPIVAVNDVSELISRPLIQNLQIADLLSLKAT